MAKKYDIDLHEHVIISVLRAIDELNPNNREFVLMESIKRSRKLRYFGRIFSYQEK